MVWLNNYLGLDSFKRTSIHFEESFSVSYSSHGYCGSFLTKTLHKFNFITHTNLKWI